ncbi:hypothetical protein FRC15_005412 [Serendipita sp. 397]|nr:hypothetical protein FRC15_005412 [Serendipita sp. 397]
MAQRPQLVLEDNILFAQVVYQLGASEWSRVSEVFLEKSTQRGKRVALNPAECQMLWTKIITRLTNTTVIDPSLRERTSIPLAPENLNLVKALYNYRLQELHNSILLKEAEYHLMKKVIGEIRSGAWDQKIVLKKSTQPERPHPPSLVTTIVDPSNNNVNGTTAATAAEVAKTKKEEHGLASSSSSQLSSLESPQSKGEKEGEEDESTLLSKQGAGEMEVDEDNEEADTTVRLDGTTTVTKKKEDTGMDLDEVDVKSPPLTPETPSDTNTKKKPSNKKGGSAPVVDRDSKGIESAEEGQTDADGERDDQELEDEEEKQAAEEELPPAKGLRKKKGPALEPLQIPTTTTTGVSSPKTTRKGKGRKSIESTGQPATATGRGARRRGGPTGRGESKAPISPASASVAGTFESAPTPTVATDENASVIEDGGRRRSTRGHKRKHSEMEVGVPPMTANTRRTRDRSATVEDELPLATATRTTATASSSIANPRLRQSMTQFMLLLTQSDHSEIFRKAVTARDAPDYARAVKRAVDLTSIQKAIKAGQIRSWDELERDLRRMLANCCMFNKPKTGAFELAKLMLVEVENLLETAKESAGDGKA